MNPGAFQTAVLWVHRLAMASLAFLSAAVLLGLFLGVTPALAALMAEARGWGDGPRSAYGTFGRLWRGAASRWRSSLPAVVPVLLLSVLAALEANFRTRESAVLLVVGGAWSLMALNHMALRLSFDLPPWQPTAELGRFLALSWLHLVSVAAWAVLVLLARPVSPFLVPLFGPAILVLALVHLGDPAARAILEGAGRPAQ